MSSVHVAVHFSFDSHPSCLSLVVLCVWGPLSLLLSQNLLEGPRLVSPWPPSALSRLTLSPCPSLSPEAESVDVADASSPHAEDSPCPASPWKRKLRSMDGEEKKKVLL